MSVAELRASLPAAHQKHLDPNAPGPARMMAAKGVVPLPPREMTIVLCGLCLQDTPEIVEAAKASLAKLPDKLLVMALEAGLPAAALSMLTHLLIDRSELIERLVLLKDTPDEAIAAVAASVPERAAEIIASNQERAMRSVAIVRSLRQNPNLLHSSRDRLFDFLVRAGVIYEDIPEFADAITRLSPGEMVEAAEKVALPADILALTQDSAEDEARANAVVSVLEAAPGSATADGTDAANVEVIERVSVLKRIASLGVSQRVALAIKGNKEARTILLRDMNRVVASAAIRNPRITEQEVIAASQSRQVCDEVVRIIANSKELSRAYGVKVALVNNPKTPLPTAMRMLTLLREADIRAVAKSKNVGTAVANQARRLVAQKKPAGS